jgi:sulfur carrier protein ThiS
MVYTELTVKLVSDKSPYRACGVVGQSPTVEERKIEVSSGDTYERVLERLNINREEAIVLCNGKPVPEDEEVADKKNTSEEITIIRIISKG